MLDLLLADGGGTATTLSDRLPVTRQAVAKHLGVLDRVGLVHGSLAGRERRYEVDEAQLARAVDQLASVGATWDARLQPHQADRRTHPAQPGRLTFTTRSAVTTGGGADEPRPEPGATTKERGTEMVDILHRVGATRVAGGRVRRPDDDRRAGRLVDRGHQGRGRRRRGRRDHPVPLRRAPEPGGFDMLVRDARAR